METSLIDCAALRARPAEGRAGPAGGGGGRRVKYLKNSFDVDNTKLIGGGGMRRNAVILI